MTPYALFISDLHLGTPQCQAELLLEFLKKHKDVPYLYIVGDAIDLWALQSKMYWPDSHNKVVQKIMKMSRKGTHVFYVLGNHDEALKLHLPMCIGNIHVMERATFEDLQGRKYLVIHGDQFDGVVKKLGWLYVLGDWAYSGALLVNSIYNRIRRLFGLKYWSLSAYLKSKVKEAVKFIGNFEKLVADEGMKSSTDIVICGHIHTPNICEIGGITYVNDGDWCESCSAAILYDTGLIQIVKHDGTVIKEKTYEVRPHVVTDRSDQQ